MTEFARLYRESVYLCGPDWDSALLLLDVSGGGLVCLSLQPGARLNALETVSGRILAALTVSSFRMKGDLKKPINLASALVESSMGIAKSL